MKKTNFTWHNLKLWLAVLILGMGANGFAQVTYQGNNFTIPALGAASGTVNVQCLPNPIANGANITLNVQLGHTFLGDLNMWLVAPTGQVLELSTRNGGGNNNMNVTFSDAGATNIGAVASAASTGAAVCPPTTFGYNGTFRPEGRNNVVTAFNVAPSNVPAVGTFTFANTFSGINPNGTWTLIADDGVGGDSGLTCNWSLNVAGVAPACNFTAGAVIPAANLGMALGTCVSAPIPAPATTGACAGVVITASVNNGPFGPPPGGLAPGVANVRWRLFNPTCNQTVNATQVITVVDTELPTIVCPANIVETLDAGECDAFVNYATPVTDDNCSVFQQIGFAGDYAPANWTFTLGPNSNGSVNVAGAPASIAITGSNGAFAVNVTTDLTVTATAAGVVTFNWSIQGDPGFEDAFFLLNGVPTLLGASNSTGSSTFPVNAGDVFGFREQSDDNTFGPGVLTITNFTAPASLPNGPTPVLVTTDFPSGGAFPIGVTTVTWRTTDPSGNSADCSFTVTVNEFPNITNQLACNDEVQISLDENCEALIGADDVLEGGLYGCYDSRYTTMIIGQMGLLTSPALVTGANINQTVTVKVIDNITGNSCWGSVVVKDKLPPVIVCRDIVVPCSQDLSAVTQPAPAIVGPQAIIFDGLNDIIEFGANSPREYDFDFGYIPAGIPVLDVDVRVKLTGHTFLPDLNMVLIAPNGTQRNLFGLTGCTGANWDIDVTWDDEGSGGLTACAALNAGGARLQCLQLPGVQNPNILNTFDGIDANGTWTLRMLDNDAGDDGVIEIVGVTITVDAPAIAPADNCSNPPAVTFVDNFTDGVCGGDAGTVTRTYTATDASGNSASCVQTITIERPTLDDVLPPADVQWTCEQYDAFPNVIEPTALHPFITDTDLTTEIIDVNLDPNCDDLDVAGTDNAGTNNTNTANGGLGCPGAIPNVGGLDDADVLALTGSGLPNIDGAALQDICEISYEWDDLEVNVCAGSFKIIRRWTLIDWCANPVDVRHFDQVIKVVDNKAPVLELLSVAGETTSNYGTHDIPALGNGGGCNQEPQLSGGTQFKANVQLPSSLTTQQLPNVRLQKLWLEIDHERVSDLDIFLRSPTGRVLQITANNGGNGTSIEADFFDAATRNVNESQFNVIGEFKPQGHDAVQYSYANIFGQGFSPNYNVEWTVTINGVPQTLTTTLTQANSMNQLVQWMNQNDPAATFGNVPYVPNWTNTVTGSTGATQTNLFFISGGYSGNGVVYGQLKIESLQNHVWYPINPLVNSVSCGGFAPNITSFAQFGTTTADVLGNWELVVFDEFANATGKVVNWKLFFSTGRVTIDVYNASTPQNAGPHAICAGTVVVPPVDGYDNCSGIASYKSELWTIVPGSNPALPMTQLQSVNTNGGVFNNVPLFANGANARYIVRHYAIDGCGNQSFIDREIELRDKVPPTPICVEETEISITNNSNQTGGSCSRLYAENLNLASYDNCKPVYFLAAKMADGPAGSTSIYNRCYYPYLDFCCDEVGDNSVILLVLDTDPTPFFNINQCNQYGPGLFLNQIQSINLPFNYNACMVNVEVTDKIQPVLVSCPPNQRITCDWYADNIETVWAGIYGNGNGSTGTAFPAEATAMSNALTALGFGAPTYYDNCSIVPNVRVSRNIDQCLEGTITRNFSFTTDAGGNAALQNCTQTINIDHVSDFVVEFPADVTINCGATVPNFGEPEIFYESCELIAVTHEDTPYNVEPGFCYKIVRTWTVLNWCVVGTEVDQEVIEQPEAQLGLAIPACDLDSDGDCDTRTFRDSWRGAAPVPNPFAPAAYRLRPHVNDAHTPNTNPVLNFRNPDTDVDTDPWDGYITYQQVIKVQDQVDPVFTNGCVIPDVCIEVGCTATVVLPTPEVTECNPNYVFQGTARIQVGGVWLNGFQPVANLAPGTYPVQYIANDGCGNQTACNTTLTVKDCKKPTPYCKNGIIIEIMQTGMVDVWASDLNDGSFDNCPGALKLSFSADVTDIANTYTCDDNPPTTIEVELWVTDAAGNQDFCETFIVLQDNMGVCTDDPRVAGVIENENDLGVEGVAVNLNSPQSSDINAVTTTTGSFNVPVVAGNDYTVTPVYDQEPLNGVTTFDLVLISKHILGVTPLGSPYKIIAADANKSGSVTTFDLVEIRKLILYINSDFPNNTSWRFVDASFNFPNVNNPFATAFPEVINLNDVTTDRLNSNFVAIKVGDVNSSAAVNLLGAAEDRTMVGDLVINADDANVEAGQEFTVDFKATDFNVSGFQFSMNFDQKALEFVGVESGLADASNFGTTMVNEGVLTASWNSDEAKRLATGDVVFSLTFKANESGRLSDMFNISSSYTVAEAYNSNSELLNVALSFNNNLVSGAFDLYQNTPNPFASVTTIGFYLPEATSATLTISDVQGKVVKVIKVQDAAKGYNTVKLNRSELGASGVLSYRLDTDSNSATRKMILVD